MNFLTPLVVLVGSVLLVLDKVRNGVVSYFKWYGDSPRPFTLIHTAVIALSTAGGIHLGRVLFEPPPLTCQAPSVALMGCEITASAVSRDAQDCAYRLTAVREYYDQCEAELRELKK